MAISTSGSFGGNSYIVLAYLLSSCNKLPRLIIPHAGPLNPGRNPRPNYDLYHVPQKPETRKRADSLAERKGINPKAESVDRREKWSIVVGLR